MPRPTLLSSLFLTALSLPSLSLYAQSSTAPPAATPHAANILGTVTAVGNDTVRIHGQGANTADLSVTITPQTRLLKTAPGETSLRNASPMQLGDLAVGDRVLVRPASNGDAQHPTAAILVAMKQGDIAQKHEQESTDWQQRGVAGIVQSADPATGIVTLRAQGGAPPLAVHVTGATAVRRYAPDSTSFADTHKAALSDIHPGDQLRARGDKDATGSALTAEEIVTGSFQNIAGTVLATDAAANTISLTDLQTKKPLTLHLEATAQLRKLPPEIAARLAHRAGTPTSGSPAQNATAHEHAPEGALSGAPAGGEARLRGGTAAMLERSPSITLADLKKGDAVMIVASGPGAIQPTAITVIAGVEPLLQASPEASAGLFSASWNLGSSGGEGGGAEPQR
jgi:hypothetical protein